MFNLLLETDFDKFFILRPKPVKRKKKCPVNNLVVKFGVKREEVLNLDSSTAVRATIAFFFFGRVPQFNFLDSFHE